MSDFITVINPKVFKKKVTTSYGIIAYTLIEGNIYYLTGRVRDSISVKEFIRGTIIDSEMIKYIQHMSKEEKHRLVSNDFNTLLDDIYVNKFSKFYTAAKEEKDHVEKNIKTYKTQLEDEKFGKEENNWIFPKGRSFPNESGLTCALREFEEETRIPKALLNIVENSQYKEYYYGLDNKLYRTIYYVAFIDYDHFQKIIPSIKEKKLVTSLRSTISEEIDVIKWMSFNDISKKLDQPKLYILRLINNHLIFSLPRATINRRHSI